MHGAKPWPGSFTPSNTYTMKRFYYTTDSKTSRTYGGSNVVASIYTMSKGELVHVTNTKWCTRSYPGEETAVMRALIAHGALPKKWSKRPDGTGNDAYYHHHTETRNFSIRSI